LFWFNARFVTMPLTKYLYRLARRIAVSDVEHSLFMALRIGYCCV